MPSITLTAAAVSAAGAMGGAAISAGGSKDASRKAMTGYNYLTQGGGSGVVNAAQDAGTAAGGIVSRTQNATSELLGTSPLTAQTRTGFNNYLNSTGYQFQLDQGQRAVSSSAASRGLLNSGGTAKALTKYGQDLSSSYFNNYLNQLGGLNAEARNAVGVGLTAASDVGHVGTDAGRTAGGFTQDAGNTMGGGVINATAGLSNSLPNILKLFGG